MSDYVPYMPIDWAGQFNYLNWYATSGTPNPIVYDMTTDPIGISNGTSSSNSGNILSGIGSLPAWLGGVTLPGSNGSPSTYLPAGAGLKAAPDLKAILLAVVIVSIITLSLPEKYGVWFPWVVLLGYGASHASTVSTLLTGGANAVQKGAA